MEHFLLENMGYLVNYFTWNVASSELSITIPMLTIKLKNLIRITVGLVTAERDGKLVDIIVKIILHFCLDTLTSVVIQFISQSLLLLLVLLDIVIISLPTVFIRVILLLLCSFSLGLLIPVKSDLPESLHHLVDRDQG